MTGRELQEKLSTFDEKELEQTVVIHDAEVKGILCVHSSINFNKSLLPNGDKLDDKHIMICLCPVEYSR